MLRHVSGRCRSLRLLIAAQDDIRATGQGTDRIFRDLRNVERDLSVAILMDCSRSTESVVGIRSIIDTMREALAALAGGIDAAGDRMAIWGLSSLRRDRVFPTRCKGFEGRLTGTLSNKPGDIFQPGGPKTGRTSRNPRLTRKLRELGSQVTSCLEAINAF
ncbi:hypothetical protein [Hoeflea sp.]|uniref:hypothetical protein n=1 Tax=Hoeflea sp. TaxID=1940281 RepID=UPI0025C05BAA|nr:hypothetical protein [Hoeflea sp.]